MTMKKLVILFSLITISVTAQNNSFALVSWNASTSSNVVGYRVYLFATGSYSPGSQATFSLATTTGAASDQATAAAATPGNSPTNAMLSGIIPALTYCVYVTSVSKDWIESEPSNIAVYQSTTNGLAPAAPGNARVTAVATVTTTITNQVTITLP